MIKRIVFFILILFSLQSCKTVGKAAKASGEVENQNMNIFRSNYEKNLPSFEYLQIKSGIDLNLKGKTNEASLRLYFDKDKMIWANVSVLGITGARAMITPEKVQGYEILDKTYVDSNFDFFNQKLGVDFIDFQKLQQLLLGQLFLIEPWREYNLKTTEDNKYELSYSQNDALKNNPKDKKYVHTFYLDSNYRLTNVDILDVKSNTHITVDYENWRLFEGRNLPGTINIMAKGKNTNIINLNYTNFDFSEMNTPFRIPNNYSERTLK